jgi:nucleoside-diphosphate-sugar epimerase
LRVVVTGAGGFVGKRLTRLLADAGHDVIALVRRAPSTDDGHYFDSPRVRIVEVDIARFDPKVLPQAVDGLITLAQSSQFRDFPNKAEEIFEVNVSANLRLLQWAARSGVARVVHASSGGVYGGGHDARLQETDLLAVDSPLGFYLGTKLCSEIVLQNYRHFFGTAVILRPFFIYGPGQRPDMFVARLVEAVRRRKPIFLQGGDGLKVNPIFVDDAVHAFAFALTLSGCHVINVAGPDVLSLRKIAEIIGAEVGIEPLFESRPGAAVDYVGDLGQSVTKLGAPKVSFRQGVSITVRGSGG